MSYAAPSFPPPLNIGSSSSSSSTASSGYAPTSTPTAGQPLLNNGKMLVYPNGWQGCPKCQNTGYKQNDPTHPCRKCWQTYGQKFNPLLISSANLQGAKVLQRPLPGPHSNNGRPGPPPSGGSYSHQQPVYPGGTAYPGGGMFQNSNTSGASFAPPPHLPPTSPPPPPARRRSPPQVHRADEASEDRDDEDGEAPPAYEDAVAVGPNGSLPPQRRDEQGRLPSNTSATPTSTSAQTSGRSFAPPTQRPPDMHIPGGYPNQPQHQQYHPYPHQYPGQGHPFSHAPGNYGPGPAHLMNYHGRPPPGALVLPPGDPRIGGQLCLKCGGTGSRESLWFGDETCSRCRGLGRIL